MTEKDPTRFRSATLSHRKVTRFRLVPDAATRKELAQSLDLIDLPEASLEGEIAPTGKADFILKAQLLAHAVQSCVISLKPVQSRIDEPIARHYLADYETPEEDEIEISEDDNSEPLPEVIDLVEVLRESLALALPPYPRAKGAELGQAVFAPEGATPLRDEDLRPFAGLAALVKKDSAEDE
ncbi:YceD family protein [Xinfangfangia sp. CPCC 101601]|uniref:YceD family protein n=1 Tax=Pseudogemmobacter lacusdianii TaxID=3069608 RepID=A0ABU0VX78_9RHOB|nr:YceD family protein [Xinfangfangia sp. CPCC 101601]MDQ2065505.1 YceD family protein [Xinfangfangia sp. CPCC 101601]